ncbi:ABC transporter permease [Paracoccus marinus]|uniref:ABC transporter permease n=1 Tax=Paracoccus marinus TaxID=288426 RepID=UPI00103B67EB|nr:ABC transporter permease [Paracoccus marinus]GLS80009.1 glutathione ABC transporter permease GsiD [Paracoccus marinus]
MRFNFMFGLFLVSIVVLAALLAGVLAPFDPIMDADLMSSELPPGAPHWMGTDAQGRDVLSRILYGARVSLLVGVVSQLINSTIGAALGISAGYFGGVWDDFVNGLTNVMLAIPSLVFALAIMAVLGPGLPSLLIALGLTNWSWTCRIARGSTLSLKSQSFVLAAKAAGFSDWNIMRTQILPNIVGPLLVIGTLGIGSAVLAEAALSFLGIGIRPPTPSWGNMLTDARELLRTAPWAAIFPGLAIFVTVLGFNLLGDGLRDMLDPHMRTRRA